MPNGFPPGRARRFGRPSRADGSRIRRRGASAPGESVREPGIARSRPMSLPIQSLPLLLPLVAALLLATAPSHAETRRNVLMIVVDDLNDWISLLDAEAPVATPNLKRLADRGMLFTRAYCASPACNPSRVATLTGLRPTTTGVYGNKSDWRGALPERRTLMQQFQAAGYAVRGAGKIFHHHLDGAFHDDASFDDFRPMRDQLYPPEKLNEAPGYGSRNTDWGAWPPSEAETLDLPTVSYGFHILQQPPPDRALFLACGIYKPHSPFFAPPAYHAGLADLPFPKRLESDWNDLPSGARKLLHRKRWFWEGMEALDRRKPGSYHAFIRSYAACARFADTQVGRLLDALDASPHRDDTIVILWSDHGFHLGEKDHIEKFALWEKSTRIPFIVVAPGITDPGSRCDVPVDLTSLYPTLLDLCGLPADPRCDGKSIVPLLQDPDREWEPPALMTYSRGNHAVRSERWRYIRYIDGTEELYDHGNDPHEWTNLARRSGFHSVLAEHRKWLPNREAQPIPDLRNRKPDKTRTHTQEEEEPRPEPRTVRPPNVLFLAIDDLRPALGCYGDPLALTPHIDELARRGILFQRAYCQQAVCSPSRLSLLTGRRPDTIRVWDLATHFRRARPDAVTLPQHFKNHGYLTRSIGKILHGSGKPARDAPSWSEPPLYDVVRDPSLRYARRENREGRGLKRVATESADVPDETYVDGLVCRAALEVIDELATKKQPFFLAVGFRKPHLPFCAPKRYWDLYDPKAIPDPVPTTHPQRAPELAVRSWMELEGYSDIPKTGEFPMTKRRELRHGYYACVSYIDALVGRLLERLEARNLTENTVICLWGDHGFHLGEQGLWTKANNYEWATRVPLILVPSGSKRTGKTTDALVELVDLYPTLAELCGLPVPEGLEGVSLEPLLQEPDRPWKTAAFSQFPRARNEPRHRGRGDFMGYALRTERYRYVEWRHGETGAVEARELYDQTTDPDETINLAADRGRKADLSRFAARLRAGWQAALPPSP